VKALSSSPSTAKKRKKENQKWKIKLQSHSCSMILSVLGFLFTCIHVQESDKQIY
jgi:hypothetical protein